MENKDQQQFANVTPEQLKSRYSNLSDQDISFLNSTDKVLKESDSIGMRKYNALIEKRHSLDLWNYMNPEKEKMTLYEKEINQILDFETEKFISDEAAKEREKEYFKIIRGDKKPTFETVKGIEITKSTLYNGFKQVFKHYTGKDFVEDSDTIPNIEAVIKYFCQDETFFNCKRLVTDFDGSKLDPSFKKGILLIGHNGNGKSTILKCMELLIDHNYKIAYSEHWHNFKDWQYLRFKMHNCHDLVSEFEGFEKPFEKNVFFRNHGGHIYTDKEGIQRHSGLKRAYDDLKREPEASNYGKKELIRAVFEKRHDNQIKTHGTCNYHPEHPGNVALGIKEFGTKYGLHIYDRIFKMFNIIEFKGKSFRK